MIYFNVEAYHNNDNWVDYCLLD